MTEPRGVTYDELRSYALTLPAVEEGMSYGTPALKVKGKLLIGLKEDGATVVLITDFYERDHLMETEPDAFYTTDHYRGYPSVLVRLAAVRPDHLRALVEDSWRRLAPAKLVAEYDRTHSA